MRQNYDKLATVLQARSKLKLTKAYTDKLAPHGNVFRPKARVGQLNDPSTSQCFQFDLNLKKD
jgi:hypothetical protein